MDTATTLRGCTLSAMVGTDVVTGLRDGLDSAQGVQGQSKAYLGQRGPRYLGSVLSLLGGVCRVGPSFGSDALRRCIDSGWHVPKRDSSCLSL